MPEKKNSATNDDISLLSYEQAFADLERIVRELENEQASLEGTLALFERGQKLIQRCTTLLEEAELRLQVLGDAAPGSFDEQADPLE